MTSKEIHQKVCDKLAIYFVNKGFKYLKSKKQLVYIDDKIKLQILFASSRSNSPKDISLQILPTFYSVELMNQKVSNGLLFDHAAIFYSKNNDLQKSIKIIEIFDGEKIHNIEDRANSEIILSRYCNIYELSDINFQKIITFIETKIIIWIEKLKTEKGILELTKNSCETQKHAFLNNDFPKYLIQNFPNINLNK